MIIAALTVGAFAWGTHAGSSRPAGHNLLRMASASSPASAPVTLVSLGNEVAQDPSADHSALPDTDTGDDSAAPGAIFQDVYSLLEEKYVDAMPTNTQFAHAAAASMLASLRDPNTRFLNPADMAEIAAESRGVYHGLGAATDVREIAHPKQGITPAYTELRLTIVAPLPGSPAEKAGLRPGDYITAVNGQEIGTMMDSTWQFDPALTHLKQLAALQSDPVSYNKLITSLEAEQKAALSLTDAQSMLSGSSGKAFTLTVMRPGAAKPMTVSVDAGAATTVTPVTSRMLPGEIGDIKIAQFTDDAAAQFSAALTSLNPATLKGLVIDLRNCPGGLLDAGQNIAAQLTSANSLGILETKGSQQSPLTITPSKTVSCPIAVLVNEGTANTAELLAATLQQNGSKVIGTTTFGDAADVRPVSLRDGSGFTMTVGELLLAQHQPFAGHGITPDVTVPETAGTDAPLSRAVELLSGQVASR